jgi:hypothetical protein
LHPTWVALCRVPQVVWDACPADRGPLTSARWGRTIRRVKVVDAGDDDDRDHTSRLQTGRLQVRVLWDVLSCLRVLVAPWLPRSLRGPGAAAVLGLRRPWSLYRGSMGGHCISQSFPGPGVAGLGAVCGADAEESERGSLSVRWVPR